MPGIASWVERSVRAAGEWNLNGMSTLLVIFLVLGATGLFLALPGTRGGWRPVGMALLVAAGILLVFVLADFALGRELPIWFGGCALVALFAATRVITHTKPVYSALYFVLLIVAVTGLLLLMSAEFLAAALVIVYAGAILVTYLFVIMLAQQARLAPYDARAREPFVGCVAGFVLLAIIAAQLLVAPSGVGAEPTVEEAAGTVEAVGTLLLTDYIIAIQLAGLLLLAGMVGAIAIARRQAADSTPQNGGVD